MSLDDELQMLRSPVFQTMLKAGIICWLIGFGTGMCVARHEPAPEPLSWDPPAEQLGADLKEA